jgi:hypothetical protein
MSDLYENDILAWSEQQTALLRRAAAGERINSNELDWPNIAEEIESVSNEQRNAVESLLTLIMQHRLQAEAWPTAPAASHWRHEIAGWRVQLRRRLRRSPKLEAEVRSEIAELYADALASMYREVDGLPRPAMPCPWTLEELLA